MNWTMPFGHDWYEVFRDMGSLIGGFLALLAGVGAYIAGMVQAHATRQAADSQIAAIDRKDRLEARCIAVAIYPEIEVLKVRHERSSKIVQTEFVNFRGSFTQLIAQRIRGARIDVPPLIRESIDRFYVLEDAGAAVLQLVSYVLQYNHMVETLAEQILADADSFDPSPHQKDLGRYLRTIEQLIDYAKLYLKPITGLFMGIEPGQM
jgi:hypothetical protein